MLNWGAAGNLEAEVAGDGIHLGRVEGNTAAIDGVDQPSRLLDVGQWRGFSEPPPKPVEHGVLHRQAARSFGQRRFSVNPPMTRAAAISFQAGKGSPRYRTDAPMPNTGTSKAIGAIVAAGWRASSQPQAA